MTQSSAPYRGSVAALRTAALDQSPIGGLTHKFYRYPARFSPVFARTAIAEFTSPGDIVLDPFMGGATTVVEAVAANRIVAGCDVNPLSTFLARVKTNRLTAHEVEQIRHWALHLLPSLGLHSPRRRARSPEESGANNLSAPQARPLKKFLAVANDSIDQLSSSVARDFARCCLLSAAQWAIDGRPTPLSLGVLRSAIPGRVLEMLAGIDELTTTLGPHRPNVLVDTRSAANLPAWNSLKELGQPTLVVTSPPYAGIHVLYHRWQVFGRRETSAPYWLVGEMDGRGGAFYTFAHHESDDSLYFERAEACWNGVRGVLANNAIVVQLVAFAEPTVQLRKYLRMMERCGFREARGIGRLPGEKRPRRAVPGRQWHAALKGALNSAREILLVHESC